MSESQQGIQAADLARVLGCVFCHLATGRAPVDLLAVQLRVTLKLSMEDAGPCYSNAPPLPHCDGACPWRDTAVATQACSHTLTSQAHCRGLQPQPAQGQVNAAALAAALSGIGGSSGGAAMQMQRAPGPSLAEVLNPETVIPLLRQPGMLEKLAQYLPVRS